MRPRVSLLLEAEDDDSLLRTVGSLLVSQGAFWELVISDHGIRSTTRADVDALLGSQVRWAQREAAGAEPPHEPPQQSLLDAASGDYVAILGQGDQVEPGVLPAVIDYLSARLSTDVLYTDEQWPAPGAEGVFTKPGWVPHYLEGWDYFGRLCLIRRSVVDAAGGLRVGVRNASEWDLHLRVTELTTSIEHLPVIGVSRPTRPACDEKANEAGVAAVTDRFRRLKVPATVELASQDGFVRVWRETPEPVPLVSIVIPTGGGARDVRGMRTTVLETCLRSLVDRTDYPNWEVVLVASEGTPEGVIDTARSIVGNRLVVARVEGRFSFSYSVNEGVRVAKGELVLLLNDDTEAIEPRWLERMVSVLQDPAVGVVGAKLYFEDMTIQHVGVIHDDTWTPHHAHRTESDGVGHFGSKIVDMDFPAVTGACLLTRRSLYSGVGGFSEQLPLAYNDVDFCLKASAAGFAVVCTPFARLYHYESSTRAPQVQPFEHRYYEENLRSLAMQDDPYVNFRSVR